MQADFTLFGENEAMTITLVFLAGAILSAGLSVTFFIFELNRLSERIDHLEARTFRHRRDFEVYREVTDLRDRRLAVVERQIHAHETVLSGISIDVEGKADP